MDNRCVLVLLITYVLSVVPGVRAMDSAEMLTLLEETRRTTPASETGGEGAYAWWIPEELMLAMVDSAKDADKSQLRKAVQIASKYNVFMVGSRAKNSDGVVEARTQDELIKCIKLTGMDGKQYSPLSDANESSKYKLAALQVESALNDMLSSVSNELYVVLFPKNNSAGESILDLRKRGIVEMKIDGEIFKWRLPLSNFVPPSVCPKCHEQFSGAYMYCPWDGTKLEPVVEKDKKLSKKAVEEKNEAAKEEKPK